MRRALLIVAALAVVLAACGSDNKSDGGSTPDTEVDVEFSGVTKLMVIAPITDPTGGGTGAYPEVEGGAKASAAALNAAGGLKGTKVEIDVCDTKADPNEAVNCAQRAVSGGYLAVVAGQDNPSNYTEPLAAAGVPNVLPFAAPPVLTDDNSYVQLGSLPYLVGGLTGMITPDVRSVSVVYLDTGSIGAQLQALSQAVTVSHPGLAIEFVPIPTSQGDYSSIVVNAAKSDAIYLALSGDPITKFVQTANDLGIEEPLGVPSTTVQGAALEQLGDLAEGLYTVAVYRSSTTDTNAGIEAYVAAMEKYAPDAFVSDLSANAYAAVQIVAAALEGSSDISPAALKAGLDALDGLETGLLPPVQFVTPSEAFEAFGLTRVFNTWVMPVKVEDGKLVPTSDYVDMLTGK